jgi:hypothetical protein
VRESGSARKTVFYTKEEGGWWTGISVHSVLLPDGTRWDAINGITHTAENPCILPTEKVECGKCGGTGFIAGGFVVGGLRTSAPCPLCSRPVPARNLHHSSSFGVPKE